jgi:purine-cytosine permease-like protein
VKNLVYPHCQTAKPPSIRKHLSASECGAEVVCGASQREKTTAGCLFTAIGVLITMVAMGLILPLVGARNEYGLAFVVGLLLAAVLFKFGRPRFGQVACMLVRSNRL